MGLIKRFSMLFKAKASKTLDRYEDPRETLDYSYARTLEMLQKMRRAVADVATSRKRIELQAQQLQQSAAKPDGQASRPSPRYQFKQSAEQLPRIYVQHYNAHRPHRTLGLQPPDPPGRLTDLGTDDRGAVRRRDLLGGLLHEYRRAA